MAAVLGLISALTIGLTDLFGRRVVAAVSPLSASAGIQVFALLGTVVVASVSRSPFERSPLLFGVASGAGMALGLAAYYTGIHRSSATIVAPITATVMTAIPFLYEGLRGTEIRPLAFIGAALAGIGLFLITSGEIDVNNLRAGVGWGLLSAIGYGGATVLFINAAAGDGLWPSAGQRLGSLFCLSVVGVATARSNFTIPRSQLANTAAAGSLTALTSLTLLAGLAINAVVATIAVSAFPAFSVIVGRVAYNDSITPRQAIGIALDVVGIALVSLAN